LGKALILFILFSETLKCFEILFYFPKYKILGRKISNLEELLVIPSLKIQSKSKIKHLRKLKVCSW
jgi:hypothetical protein